MLMGYTFVFSPSYISKTTAPIIVSPNLNAMLFSGLMDTYYRYNFNAPRSDTGSLTNFRHLNIFFEFGMVSLAADSFGNLRPTAGLGFGRAREDFFYNDNCFTLLLPLCLALFIHFKKVKEVVNAQLVKMRRNI